MVTTLGFKDMKKAIDIVIDANHVPNIVGLQGIGKSDLVRGYCKEKGYYFDEINCSLIQEGDLAMPFILERNGGKDVGYAISKIIKEVCENASDGRYSVLFLDEFNRATSAVQSELMNLVLQREVAGFKLSKNVRIILAMNPSSAMAGFEDSNYDVSFSDSAIMGRVDTLIMKPHLTDWLAYGSSIGEDGNTIIYGGILKFLKENKALFITKEVEGELNNTPRGWSRASDIVKNYLSRGYKPKDRLLLALLKGTLENQTATTLHKYLSTEYNTSVSNYDIMVRLLGSDDLDSEMPKFNSYSLAKKQEIMLLGVPHLDSGEFSSLREYSNFVTMLISLDVNIAFRVLDELLKYSKLFDELTEYFPDFVKLVEKYAD